MRVTYWWSVIPVSDACCGRVYLDSRRSAMFDSPKWCSCMSNESRLRPGIIIGGHTYARYGRTYYRSASFMCQMWRLRCGVGAPCRTSEAVTMHP